MGELFDLTGRVAVVAGSSRGIGKAIALRYAEHGASVVVSSRKPDACCAAIAEINDLVGRDAATSIPANISVKSELQNLATTAIQRLGKIDILVCNAATNPYMGTMNTIPDDVFTKVMHNNLTGYHWLVHLVAPQMISRRDGSIILMSSIGGMRGGSGLGAYQISKAAVIQLARTLAVEFGPSNVRVNAIAPGLVTTDFARALWDDPDRRRAAELGIPLRRLGVPDDIAGTAVLLASRAGAWITGQTIVVDGGRTT